MVEHTKPTRSATTGATESLPRHCETARRGSLLVEDRPSALFFLEQPELAARLAAGNVDHAEESRNAALLLRAELVDQRFGRGDERLDILGTRFLVIGHLAERHEKVGRRWPR